MKLHLLALISALQLSAVVASSHHGRVLHRRQNPPSGTTTSSSVTTTSTSTTSRTTTTTSTSSTTSSTTSSSTTGQTTPPTPPTPPVGGGTTTTSTTSSTTSGTTTTTSTTTKPTGPPPLRTDTAVPPLESISVGMATKATLVPGPSYSPGATPPVKGAPPLPTPFVFQISQWPERDHVPPTDTPEVTAWMKELDGWDIPDLNPTINGSCKDSPEAAAQAAQRGWWTCGGYTRDTDITACPDKMTWGVSFDDGPTGYTKYLLNYLDEKQLSATFFVVGSRVTERPNLLIEEYMKGHEISVHTWSHRPLTSLTNAQIVAELGWTRKAIKTVLGVTPTTMRPPYGDIDDRVRAISLAMGMVPIIWSRSPSGAAFDTEDWKVAADQVNSTSSFNTFKNILSTAQTMDTGFIVLQHDLYEIEVDLAVGYTLPAALEANFNLEAIGQCAKIPTTDLYLESNTNTTFPHTNQTSGGGVDTDGDGVVDVKSGDQGKTAPQSSGNNNSGAIATRIDGFPALVSLLAVGVAMLASVF